MLLEVKVLEIRDTATCIPAMAIRMGMNEGGFIGNSFISNQEKTAFHWLLHTRCGFAEDGSGIVLMKISNQEAYADPYDWNDRTMKTAHHHIYEHFSSLKDGDVIDVRFILGETSEPVKSDRNFIFDDEEN